MIAILLWPLKTSDMGKEAIETATKVAGIGAGAAVAIAATVGAPVTITVALVGAGIGCIGGALLSKGK